jgi:hypothetical protein
VKPHTRPRRKDQILGGSGLYGSDEKMEFSTMRKFCGRPPVHKVIVRPPPWRANWDPGAFCQVSSRSRHGAHTAGYLSCSSCAIQPRFPRSPTYSPGYWGSLRFLQKSSGFRLLDNTVPPSSHRCAVCTDPTTGTCRNGWQGLYAALCFGGMARWTPHTV